MKSEIWNYPECPYCKCHYDRVDLIQFDKGTLVCSNDACGKPYDYKRELVVSFKTKKIKYHERPT